jgi:hypothetical protein
MYSFLVSDLCGIASCLLFCASYISDQVVSVALSGEIHDRQGNRFGSVLPELLVLGGAEYLHSDRTRFGSLQRS